MRRVQVFISSPGDLGEQRQAVAELITNLNMRPQLRDRYKFIPMRYELSAPPVAGTGPQEVVDQQMSRARDADIVICMLWSRLGTPLAEINPDTGQPYNSGTEYEFYDAYRSYQRRRKPLLLLYRCAAPIPADANPEQVAKVISFFERFNGPRATLRGLYKTFTTTDDLRQALTNDLETLLANWEKPMSRLFEQIIRPFAPVLVLFLILLAVLLYFLSPKTPPPKIGAFNVAISQFMPASGVSEVTARSFTAAFYNTFVESLNANKLDASGISAWTPEQVGSVRMTAATDNMELKARDLALSLRDRYGVQPNIVVYGQIELKDGDYVVTPRFYVSDKLYEARDVYGGFAMGPVMYGSNTEETLIRSGDLAKRSRALTYIAQGLLQLVAADFESAHSTLGTVIDLKLEADTPELIYTMMGNTTLAALDTEAGYGTAAKLLDRTTLLDRAEQDFTNAINRNRAYARAYLGRASVLYLRYLQPAVAVGDWTVITDAQLKELETAYQAVLTASEQPTTADLPEKVQFGLGQIAVIRYLRGDQAQWQTAKTAFESVIAAYEKLAAAKKGEEIRLQALAAEAHNRIGLLWEKEGDLDAARTAYQKAVEIISDQPQYRARRDVLRRNLIALNINQLRADGKVDDAAKLYEELLTIKMPNADAAAYRYEQAKMFDEATPPRPRDAVDALQKGLVLDLSNSPVLVAQLYRFLGDLYLGELNQTKLALAAYEQALKIDPTGQANLQSLITKLRNNSESSATVTP